MTAVSPCSGWQRGALSLSGAPGSTRMMSVVVPLLILSAVWWRREGVPVASLVGSTVHAMYKSTSPSSTVTLSVRLNFS